MERKYDIRLKMLGTSHFAIAEALDVNHQYCKILSEKRTAMHIQYNYKPVIEVIETSPNYYAITMNDKVLKSLLERIIINHQATRDR